MYAFGAYTTNMQVLPLIALLTLAAPQDEIKPVGSTLWRIGNPGLYLSAPKSLKSAPIEWGKGLGWVAEEGETKVEVLATDASQLETLTKALGERTGGSASQVKVSGYPAARWGSSGSQALLVSTPRRVWVIAAKGKAEDVAKTIETAMLDRVDHARWQDRNLGMTSLQASLPFRTAPLLESKSDSNTQEVAWDGIRLMATEFRGSVDFDKTVELQTNDMKAQGAANIERSEFKAGYLTGKGVRLTATVAIDGRQERIHKVLASVGTRVALVSLHLNGGEARHLAIEKRFLETLRVGWTTFDDFEPQAVIEEKVTFEGSATLTSSMDNESLRLYGAGGWLLYSLNSKGAVPNWPQEGKDLNAIVGQIVTNAGGRWQGGQDRIAGFGAFMGVLATGQGQGQRGTVFTAAGSTFSSQRGYLWVYMTETVSFDVMAHVADSARFDFPLPEGWNRTGLGPIAIGLPEGTPKQGEGANVRWRAEKNGVRVTVELSDLPASGDAVALVPAGGHRARTHLERGFGWVHQAPVNDGPYRLQDTLVLIVGSRVAKVQVAWSPEQSASGIARDAVLASISTP